MHPNESGDRVINSFHLLTFEQRAKNVILAHLHMSRGPNHYLYLKATHVKHR